MQPVTAKPVSLTPTTRKRTPKGRAKVSRKRTPKRKPAVKPAVRAKRSAAAKRAAATRKRKREEAEQQKLTSVLEKVNREQRELMDNCLDQVKQLKADIVLWLEVDITKVTVGVMDLDIEIRQESTYIKFLERILMRTGQ